MNYCELLVHQTVLENNFIIVKVIHFFRLFEMENFKNLITSRKEPQIKEPHLSNSKLRLKNSLNDIKKTTLKKC